METAHSQNINDTFFSGMYKDVWRKMIPDGLSETEVDFIEKVAGLTKGAHVLDSMCGYGRHALEMGKRGINVTAVDNQPDYINNIQTIAEKEALPVQVILSDAISVKLNQVYDAAICMGNSFAFFNEQDAAAMLCIISNHLKSGGTFIINSWMIGEIAIKYFREKDWFLVEGYKYLIDNKYFFNPARIESEHIIIAADGRTESIKAIDYIFTFSELDALFKKSGFIMKDSYSTPKMKKFRFGDTRVYIVAEKI